MVKFTEDGSKTLIQLTVCAIKQMLSSIPFISNLVQTAEYDKGYIV